MRLSATRSQYLVRNDPSLCVIEWLVDVFAPNESGSEEFCVGRIVADEVRRFEADEQGYDPFDVADGGSSGLDGALAHVVDSSGQFREDAFASAADPLVYIDRFELHPDFPIWRMALMDAFCRIFEESTVILARYHAAWLSDAEFKMLGFFELRPRETQGPPLAEISSSTEYMIRENSSVSEFELSDYPDEYPFATPEHSDWVEKQSRQDESA